MTSAPPPRPRLRVALVQGMLAHFREALFRRLDASTACDFTFHACGHDVAGIVHLPPGTLSRERIAPVHAWRGLYWQSGIVKLAFARDVDVLVLMGDPHYLSTWAAAACARLRGRPVLFWTHGWLRRERGARRLLRLAFYRLADRLAVYSERGKALGIAEGYPAQRIGVVYNSLDLARADPVFARLEAGGGAADAPGAFFADPARPLLVCTARLTPACRFDLLLDAAAQLEAEGTPVNLLLIGDGPMRGALEAQAAALGLAVQFTGAVYGEERLGPWLYHADITVSPGKVGLTAIHSMMFGTPVITHGNLDRQMPEVEAIEDGRTGAFFAEGDAADLARAIAGWLAEHRDREQVRRDCRAVVERQWNPENHARLLERAIAQTAARSLPAPAQR